MRKLLIMKKIMCLLSLIFTILLSSCSDKLLSDAPPVTSFEVFLYNEDGQNLLSGKTERNLRDIPITIVFEDDTIVVENNRHPEWQPMWPSLDGSVPPLFASLFPDDEIDTLPSDFMDDVIEVCTTGNYQLYEVDFEFILIVGSKKWNVEIRKAREVYMDGVYYTNVGMYNIDISLTITRQELQEILVSTEK